MSKAPEFLGPIAVNLAGITVTSALRDNISTLI